MLVTLLNLRRLFLKYLLLSVLLVIGLHRMNVTKVNEKDCSDLILSVNTGVTSSDKEYYICLTCHKSLKKNNFTCQSVSNNLFLAEIPKEISAINILEKEFICQRLLF